MKFHHLARKSVITVLLLSLLVSGTIAQNPSSGITRVRSIEGITEYRLANGLQVLLFPDMTKQNITVNCVTPAAVKTPIFAQVTQQHIDFMLQKIPMGRFGLVEEIAAMVCWLCSEDASFSTGAVFDLSGGRGTY